MCCLNNALQTLVARVFLYAELKAVKFLPFQIVGSLALPGWLPQALSVLCRALHTWPYRWGPREVQQGIAELQIYQDLPVQQKG